MVACSEELGCTPLYLRYNTGRHISTNGQEFAQLLEQLCEAWPVPVESLSLIGHSMGGLVIRSASWYAQQAQSTWLQHLQRVVCLGTPHHGSPVERAGHALDRAMQRIPYTEPLALGRRRSAGIKDLRHGDLLDEDWQGHHPDRHRPDTAGWFPCCHRWTITSLPPPWGGTSTIHWGTSWVTCWYAWTAPPEPTRMTCGT